MELYRTICKESHTEQIIEKSRFITHIKPVEDKESADAFISEMKKKYKDATHNVPAMVIGENMQVQWGSDDGEPQGTSGAPIVQMLVNEGITNVVVVVTRYFGGIKLGTGGLVRAYTGSAKMGIEASGVCYVKKMCVIKYQIDYTFLSTVQKKSVQENFIIDGIEYSEKIILTLVIETEQYEKIITSLSNATNGKGKILEETVENRKVNKC